jgi:hypothetical protein
MTIDCKITRGVEIARTPRVRQLEGIFDVPPSERSERAWHHRITLPDAWSIGVIVGPSGSGKTTLAREMFGQQNPSAQLPAPNADVSLVNAWPWPNDKSLLDGFPAAMGIRDITALLCSVGFSSPPAWVRPFAALSTGEQFRVHLARTLAEMPRLAIVDEFTSVVDRTAARIGSAAVAKAVRARKQQFIAVTCHYDVLDWLEPDWVYEPHTMKLTLNSEPGGSRGLLWRRPEIELEIIRVFPAAWNIFKPHHYLSGRLHPASRCYLAMVRLDDDAGEARPAAFVAALPFPHPRRPGWREHRCVCLPEFQGVGIGNAMSECIAGLFTARGKRYTSATSHPAMIAHRVRSPLWKMIRRPALGNRHRGFNGRITGSVDRMTAAFEFVDHRDQAV